MAPAGLAKQFPADSPPVPCRGAILPLTFISVPLMLRKSLPYISRFLLLCSVLIPELVNDSNMLQWMPFMIDPVEDANILIFPCWKKLSDSILKEDSPAIRILKGLESGAFSGLKNWLSSTLRP